MKNGPALSPIYVGAPRPLSRGDLELLKEGNRSPNGTVKRLRDSHHMIARLTVMGLKPGKIAERLGMTRARVTQLLSSPAMVELVAVYRNRLDEQFDEQVDAFFEIASSNMLAAQRHIADRFAELDDDGELMPVREALAVAADAADRVGYGKRSTNVNINVDFAAQLEKARARSAKVIEASATEVKTPVASAAPPTLTPQVESQPRPFLQRRRA